MFVASSTPNVFVDATRPPTIPSIPGSPLMSAMRGSQPAGAPQEPSKWSARRA